MTLIVVIGIIVVFGATYVGCRWADQRRFTRQIRNFVSPFDVGPIRFPDVVTDEPLFGHPSEQSTPEPVGAGLMWRCAMCGLEGEGMDNLDAHLCVGLVRPAQVRHVRDHGEPKCSTCGLFLAVGTGWAMNPNGTVNHFEGCPGG